MQRITVRACVIAVLGISAFLAAPRAEIIEQVLVKVNGEIFTKTELEARQVSTLRALGQADAASKPNDAQLRKMLDDLTPQLMVNIIDEMLLVQRGKELGYTLSDEQFKTILDNIKKENQLDTDAAFQAALKQEGMTMADLRKQLERQAMMTNVTRNEVQNKITVSEDETRKFYEAHIKEFTTSPTVTLREVMIGATAGAVEAEAAARQKAEDIRSRALAGESLEKLAAELSDSPSKANGGLIGPFSLDDLSAEVRRTIESLKVGEMTPVLRATNGYQILKLETRTDSKVKSFEEARGDIANRIGDQKLRGEREKYLDRLREQATITWRNTELQKAYETALARRHEASGSKPQASTTN